MNRAAPLLATVLLVASVSAASPPAPVAGIKLAPLRNFYDYRLLQTDAGKTAPREVSASEAGKMLAGYDVIFIGEAHRHPGSHLLQMDLFSAVYANAPRLSLSMEQFTTDVQGVVDDYMAGKIGDWTLKRKGEAWDNYDTSYRPLVTFAKERGLPVIAAEAPIPIIACIGKEGLAYLDRISADKRALVAREIELNLGSAYHDKYKQFAASTSTHGKGDGEQDAAMAAMMEKFMNNSYAGQVARDETMAESIFKHLQANPGRKVLHIDGAFHSDGFMGTVERLQRRNPALKIAVVSPVTAADAKVPAITVEQAGLGNFVAITYPVADDTLTEEEEAARTADTMAKRKKRDCSQ